jgi:hypothetical protein
MVDDNLNWVKIINCNFKDKIEGNKIPLDIEEETTQIIKIQIANDK